MKRDFALPLLTAALLAASLPAQAATRKDDSRTAALVAALQAVSPDPLGGSLGLAASTIATPTVAPVATKSTFARTTRAVLDQRTYLIWKSSLKS